MAATALRRPVGHEDRLSLIEHLDELRSRLIVCALSLAAVFGICLWQNGPLLSVVNHPLANITQRNVDKGRGPLGQTSLAQEAVKKLAAQEKLLARTLAARGSGLSDPARAQIARQARGVDAATARLPAKVPGNKPVTLGVSEPFSTTLTVAFYFSLLFAMPLILWQLYAFVLPAFSPKERRAALPLLAMIPALFTAGVMFGYFVVLPAALKFLQNFNADQFNVLVQAKDYYRFTALTLLALGIVFQVPVGILALVRLGVVSVRQLRKNRRYAIVVCAVVAMLLPGTDPVSMLLEMVPLVLLYELSILLASFGGHPAEPEEEDLEPDAL